MTGSHASLLETVGALHDGVVEEAAWTSALDSVREMLGGATLLLITVATGRIGYEAEGHGIDDDALAAITGTLAVPDPRINPWYAAMPRLPRQRIITLSEIAPSTVEQSVAWRDFIQPTGTLVGPCAILERLPERVDIGMTFTGSLSPGASDRNRKVYTALIPHLARAMRVRHELARMKMLTGAALDALDCLTRGVVITGPEGEVRFANRAAENLLSDGDGLTTRGGRIVARHLRGERAMAGLIDNAAKTAIGDGLSAVDAVALERPSGKPPIAVVAEPLSRSHSDRLLDNTEHGTILFLSDPDRIGLPSAGRLATLYALTPAESEVTSRLAHGDSRAVIARDLGVSEHTVKTHQTAVFAKLDVHRQAELVRRVAIDIGDVGAVSA